MATAFQMPLDGTSSYRSPSRPLTGIPDPRTSSISKGWRNRRLTADEGRSWQLQYPCFTFVCYGLVRDKISSLAFILWAERAVPEAVIKAFDQRFCSKVGVEG
jgi:hypothetical protein